MWVRCYCLLQAHPSGQRPAKRSNSLSLQSCEISKETGGLAGCWHHLAAGFLIYISEYLGRALGDVV